MKVLASKEEFEKDFFSHFEAVQRILQEVRPETRKNIVTCAYNFIALCTKHMKKKLPFLDEVLNNSSIIFLHDSCLDMEVWNKLKNRFTNVIENEKMRENFSTQVEQFNFHYRKIKANYIKPSYSILQVWHSLSEEFPTLSILARALCVLPTSTVNLERTFSKLKEVKSPKRNRLTVENLEACLLTQQYFGTNVIVIKPKLILEMIESETEEDEGGVEENGEGKKKKVLVTKTKKEDDIVPEVKKGLLPSENT